MRSLFLLAAMLLLSSTPVFADDDEKSCNISRAAAQEIALMLVSGSIKDTDLKKADGGMLYWSIEVKPAGDSQKEVHIDAQTGTVLSVENDH